MNYHELPIDKFRDYCAVMNYAYMAKASERMEDEISNAKNRQGILMKYTHGIIPGRCLPGYVGDPFDFGDTSDVDNLYTSAAIGIGMSMYERLEKLRVSG